MKSILVIDFLKHLVGKVKAIDHPSSLQMMTFRGINIFIGSFKEAIINTIGMSIWRCIRTKQNSVLIFDHKLPCRVRLSAQLADACVDVYIEIWILLKPHGYAAEVLRQITHVCSDKN